MLFDPVQEKVLTNVFGEWAEDKDGTWAFKLRNDVPIGFYVLSKLEEQRCQQI